MAQGIAELAYLGDAVFELMVREKLLNENTPIKLISKKSRNLVSAPAQSEMYHRIFDMLTDDEKNIIKRGRNLHTNSRSKNADVVEYRHATGLEALFGWLHLNKNQDRLLELFQLCTDKGDSKDEKR